MRYQDTVLGHLYGVRSPLLRHLTNTYMEPVPRTAFEHGPCKREGDLLPADVHSNTETVLPLRCRTARAAS